MSRKPAIGIGIAVAIAALGLVALASDSARTEKPAAVDAQEYADFMAHEALDMQDLAEGAEIQRRMFNRMTPPGLSWVQTMFPLTVPFDAENFDDSFLEDLLGEDRNSVAVYPLSLVLDPKTRETLVYNAEGKLIASIPDDKNIRSWPEDADPARVTLQLDLLPSEDVEPYLYTESRVEESTASAAKKSAKVGGPVKRSLGASEFGICNIQKLTDGNMRLTLTNGTDAAEVYAYTVLHTSSVVVVTWTNEQYNVVTDTNTLWTPVSPPFNGLKSAWACAASNLALTNGAGAWEDANISSNARVRFYGVANRMSSDEDGLTDGAETFLYHTDSDNIDTDGDGLLDGYDIVVGFGDARYVSWTGLGIIYFENGGVRTFKGELSAGSDPLDDDSDDDGFLDGWEVHNDLDPLDGEGDNGPEGDPDGDGFDNALESELGAPANNSAWNGEELAYRLSHVNAVVVTNARSVTTNFTGLRVTVEDSWDCVAGGNHGIQNNTADFAVPALLECGYYINVAVEGMVEGVDAHYDEVSFEAVENTPYFGSHDDIPDGEEEYCLMVDESAVRNNLILANSTVKLRYDTVGYRWHSGGYAEIVDAVNMGPYQMVVSGDDAICAGETTMMEASGGAEAPYAWSGSGYISVNSTGNVTGLAPGFATVTASDYNGCSGAKQIAVLKADIGAAAPLADRTLHPNAARKPLLLKQTLPAEWNGLMHLSLSGAGAYWTPTGGTSFTSGIFTNAQLPQTIYLEGDGCGVGEASFAIVGPPGCETNTPLNVFGVNATLAGVAELDEESPGGFIADHTTDTNVPRTALNLAACGSSGSSGNLVLTWDSSLVQIYTSATGGTALAQFSTPFSGFNGTNLYVEGIAPGSNTLSWGYSGQSDCVDVIKVTVLKVETAFADPDDANWGDLEEKKVILSDKDTRIKIKVTPQLADLQTIFDAIGTDLKICTSGTAPNGQDFTMTSQNTTLVQESGYSELRVALTRSQLISLGVLPSQESDSVTEKAWYDTGFDTTVSAPNLLDGEAFNNGMSAEIRGQCTQAIYGGLDSSPPNSPLDGSFFQAGGIEIITAECCSSVSDKRQLMNQADYFYYSGHGYHSSGTLYAGGPSDVSGYWDKDLDVVIIAGCSVLDVNDYNNNFTNPVEHALSPGEEWEPLGPSYLLGYNYTAPTDLQNSDSIITSWLSNRGSLGNVEAWREANDNSNGHNACAITKNASYYYFRRILGFPVWTEVQKADW